jgi:glycosyltransferase involved in cell wall biosynthesis
VLGIRLLHRVCYATNIADWIGSEEEADAPKWLVSTWHIITGEYPPQIGGVSDYTCQVANALAKAGNTVHVWASASCPADRVSTPHASLAAGPASHPCSKNGKSQSEVQGTEIARANVHWLPGHFGIRTLAALTRSLRTSPPGCVLVQYVPHAFGYKAMNLPFCLWLNTIRKNHLMVMFHEVAFPLSNAQPARHNLLGAVTRLMAWLVCRRASTILVASARWEVLLRRLGITAPVSWVPVPSNVPVVDRAGATAMVRKRYVDDPGLLVGHFANYSDYAADRLSQTVPALLDSNPRLSVLLVGTRSHDLGTRLINQHPATSRRLYSTGVLEPSELSCTLAACDLMVQPYPDGVSTRRGSVTALLAHRRAIVTTSGAATEELWSSSDAVALAPADDFAAFRRLIGFAISNPQLRRDYERAAGSLYESRFALRHTVAALMDNGDAAVAGVR